MARHERTAEQFDAIAKQLLEASQSVDAIVEMLRSNNMPAALIHSSTTLNLYLPAVLEWVDKTAADVKIQLRSFLADVPSSASVQVQKNANQKLAVGKKSVKKKTT